MLQDLYFVFSKRVLGIILFVCILSGFFWYLLLQKQLPAITQQMPKAVEEQTVLPDFFRGSLFLEPMKIPFSLKELTDQMQIGWAEPRPGSKQQKYLQVVLNDEEKIFSLEDKIFLTYDQKFKLCEHSLLFLIPQAETETEKMAFQVVVQQDGKNLNIQKLQLPISVIEDKKPAGLGLGRAVFLPPDQFAVCFAEDQNLKNHRLVLEDGKILYLQEGDFYLFQDGSWQKTDNLEKNCDLALLKISSCSSKELGLELWEKESRKFLTYKPQRTASKPQIKEDFLQDLRLRTQHQTALKIDRQRLILKKGDLVVRKDKWQLLKKPQINAKLLSFIHGNEFFVVEEITKKIFKARFFNQDRTFFQRLEKQLSKTNRARKKR